MTCLEYLRREVQRLLKHPTKKCVEWPFGKFGTGYGGVWVDGMMRRAHRVAFKEAYGPIPEGMDALHDCDNRPCINPAHLFPGTQADNIADMVAKGRQAGAVGNRNGRHTHPERTARGVEHARARVSVAQVKRIRARYAAGDTLEQIAARLRVSYGCVYHIAHRLTWKHV